ncbi:MAG: hypothetical protein M3Z70_08390 [Bartonella sp.]|nr:hypothetical protein [Bartonella sp.]
MTDVKQWNRLVAVIDNLKRTADQMKPYIREDSRDFLWRAKQRAKRQSQELNDILNRICR